ncbi:SDR family NAD(P)-dependent oxidoreductase [Sphingobacterium corticibacter]|uniref:Short-chain dehydrogenase n=1 Tax=Sphingobacterium corticibacter TaxID=2171749 RepID=A0A2T8HIP4_9SPHI|nr:SDR family oxidoreductase [Sphingobacterium corticibacter]PVH25311.1 short-chain dehydrogenase [Sphingobacterium corticibacter]
MGKLDNKVAIITGSDSGIGRAIAEALGEEGAKVIITYHSDEDSAKETSEYLTSQNVVHTTYQLDVSDEKSVNKIFEKVVDEYGQIDILVNNAGVNGSNIKVVDMDNETFDTCIKTNLYGPFYCTRKYLRLRKATQKGGKIINVSSIHEEVVTAGNSDYNASKGGLKNFSRSLALELAQEQIQVNNIAPGMILTSMNQEAMDDKKVKKEKEQHIPMKRAGETKDIKAAAIFLASADSDYVTGSTITIDGGLSINLGQGA